MPEPLFNSTVRHAVYLESIKAQEVNQFAAFLKNIDKDLRERLTRDDITNFSRARLERLLGSVDKSLEGIFNDYYDDLAGHLVDLAEYESEFEARNLDNAISTESFESVIPAPEQVRTAVFAAPLSVRGADGGKLLEPFIKDWASSDKKHLTGIVRQGFFEGQTNFEILRNIRGTKSAGFKDGALNTVSRHAEAIVRTSVQHVASVARFETWRANPKLINGYRWVSTLDHRTSTICRSLDGEVFSLGKGPKPPIHIRCRSTTVAVLNEKYNFLSKGRTRASKDGPVSANLNYYDWLKKQSGDFQDDVLGPVRGKIFRDGGLSVARFQQLQLDKNFKPLTLAEIRKKEPNAFDKAANKTPLTKQAENAVLAKSRQRDSLESWLGAKKYKSLAGEVSNPRIKKQSEEYGLHQAEAIAIRNYTGTGYSDLNGHLWGENKENARSISESADVLREGLKKLPSYEGLSYRRTTLPKDVLSNHEIGSVVEYKAFTSTSYEGEVFSSGSHRIIINGHGGKKIGWISKFQEQEREVLFTSPTKMRVEDRYNDEDGILNIILSEL